MSATRTRRPNACGAWLLSTILGLADCMAGCQRAPQENDLGHMSVRRTATLKRMSSHRPQPCETGSQPDTFGITECFRTELAGDFRAVLRPQSVERSATVRAVIRVGAEVV